MCKMTTQRDRAIVAVLAGSGIRVGEVCTMQLDRLDLTNKRFYVTGKGSKERLCFLTPRAKVELAKYLSERKGDLNGMCPKSHADGKHSYRIPSPSAQTQTLLC